MNLLGSSYFAAIDRPPRGAHPTGPVVVWLHLAASSPEDRRAGALDDRAGKALASWADVPTPAPAIEAEPPSKLPDGEGRLARSGR
jgi:hypothetical protein